MSVIIAGFVIVLVVIFAAEMLGGPRNTSSSAITACEQYTSPTATYSGLSASKNADGTYTEGPTELAGYFPGGRSRAFSRTMA